MEPSPDKALRFNTGKLQFELIPPKFTEELAKVFTKGAMKYAPENWKKSLNTKDHSQFMADRLGSALRHINKFQQGELVDSERVVGAETIITNHLAHAAWNLLCLMWYELNDDMQDHV